MTFVQVLWFYVLWHYTKAWQDIFRIIGNYLWFVSNFFSINLLLKTLLSPWRRLSVSSGKGAEDGFLEAFLINTLMRAVGFFVRAFAIIVGVAALFISIFLSLVLVIAWLFLPLVIFFLFFGGMGQFVKAFL